MKFSFFASMAIVLALSACSAETPDEKMMRDAKTSLFEGCKKTGSAMPGMTQRQVTTFCTCSTGKTLAILGTEGVRALRKNGDFSEDEKTKIKAAGLACSASILK